MFYIKTEGFSLIFLALLSVTSSKEGAYLGICVKPIWLPSEPFYLLHQKPQASWQASK